MDFASYLVQALNGLAAASSLFLVAAGLSLIFGVTRIVNFAHGSFFMLGVYLAYSLVSNAAPVMSATLSVVLGNFGAESASQTIAYFLLLFFAALLTGALGALVEVLVLRRIYKAPELFQLLATFALVLIMQDATLWLWGAEDLLGPRAPGLSGAVDILGRRFPTYDLFLICMGPLVLAVLWWSCNAHALACWCAPPRKTARCWERLALTPAICLPRSLLWAAPWPAWAVPCNCRVSPRTWGWTWPPLAMRLWWWWSVAWARFRGHL